MKNRPTYGWYGDDFTGATDMLATIAERGHRAFLFLEVPDDAKLADIGALDAIGIAGATRTMGNADIASKLDRAGRFFRDSECKVLNYKCCSTFDSAKSVGNLASAAKVLASHTTSATVAVLGGQPSLERYCVFSNLFAKFGDSTYRLDRHPTMSQHPSTPMVEADLTRHLNDLGATKTDAISFVDLETIPAKDLAKRLTATDAEFVLFDALTQHHVDQFGAMLHACEGSFAVLGASGVAEAWFAKRNVAPLFQAPAFKGPVLAFAGSLSQATSAQIAAAQSYRKYQVEPETITSEPFRTGLIDAAASDLNAGRNVLIASSAPDRPRPTRAKRGFSDECGRLVDAVLDRAPVKRLAIAGGDTSSAVAQNIDIWGLAYRTRFGCGTCICTTRSDRPDRDGIQILLKGGQLGAERLFDDFAALDEEKTKG
ncbi:MAG: four-carbon acid sugar kinase family protein [Marinosulfonomonas sp.]